MDNEMLNKFESDLNTFGTNLRQVELLYPKIFEPMMPLSITGVSPRTYFYWKESGLVDKKESEEKQGWVRLNLVDFIWVRIIQTLRDYGTPFEIIKKVKCVLFSDFIEMILEDEESFFEEMRKDPAVTDAKEHVIRKYLENFKKEKSNTIEEYKDVLTLLGNVLIGLIFKNDNGYLTITRKKDDFDIGFYTSSKFNVDPDYMKSLFNEPALHIPITNFIEEVLQDVKFEKYVDAMSLLDIKEKKVIEAIRKKDFKEIIIKQDGNRNSIIIEIEKDGAVLDQKAKELRRILGMNEYSEITLKYRNDKHLYFKNKIRL